MSECTQHHWPNEEGKCPYCEIERLRAHVEAVEGRNDNLAAVLRFLSAEVAKKDKRIEDMKFDHEQITALEVTERDRMRRQIEELEEALSKSIMHQKELDRCVHITTEQLASGEVVLLTQGQIDAAWETRHWGTVPDHTEEHVDDALERLGIVACEECGGSGERDRSMYQPNGDPTDPTPDECSSCHGHGWVWKETTGADLMASGDWVDDNE